MNKHSTANETFSYLQQRLLAIHIARASEWGSRLRLSRPPCNAVPVSTGAEPTLSPIPPYYPAAKPHSTLSI